MVGNCDKIDSRICWKHDVRPQMSARLSRWWTAMRLQHLGINKACTSGIRPGAFLTTHLWMRPATKISEAKPHPPAKQVLSNTSANTAPRAMVLYKRRLRVAWRDLLQTCFAWTPKGRLKLSIYFRDLLYSKVSTQRTNLLLIVLNGTFKFVISLSANVYCVATWR